MPQFITYYQGYEMQRGLFIHVTADDEEGAVTKLHDWLMAWYKKTNPQLFRDKEALEDLEENYMPESLTEITSADIVAYKLTGGDLDEVEDPRLAAGPVEPEDEENEEGEEEDEGGEVGEGEDEDDEAGEGEDEDDEAGEGEDEEDEK
jgi:hypothetical protein